MAQEPAGLLYQPDFISAAQERVLVAEIERLTFSEVRMHGVTAKRRVAHFGWDPRKVILEVANARI